MNLCQYNLQFVWRHEQEPKTAHRSGEDMFLPPLAQLQSPEHIQFNYHQKDIDELQPAASHVQHQ